MLKTKAKQVPMHSPRFEQVFHKDHRYCACEMPMTSKKWNEALGTFVVIRLCCMAKTVMQIAERLGIEADDLYAAFDFDPKWVWDCKELHQGEGLDGTVEMRERGVPPRWLLERLKAKGIVVKNLPAGME